MDPASAIGVTSAVITFLEFSWKVVRNAKEIYDSADGCPNDNLTRESVARSMQVFSRRLQPPDPSKMRPEYQGIYKLARECQNISREILEISDSLKIGGVNSRYKALRTGLKAWRFKKDLILLEEKLSRCGDQLSLELSYLKSEQITYSLDQIRSLATDKLEQIQRSVDELRQATEINLGADILAHVRDILQRQDRALDRVCQDRILQSLCSSYMDSRYDQVHLPADGTFTWVLDPDQVEKSDPSPKHDESDPSHGYWGSRQRRMQLQSSKKFVNWLALSDGIFHISGKLGSGKSTLMKLLHSHPRTRKELEVWSGSKTLFTAKFFFWKHGTNSQNSLNGLYRSLLHSILTEYPELIPSVLPSYWGKVKKDTAVVQSLFPITAETIERSLFMLLKNESLYESRRLCIFIDGLDEFVGSGQHDYRTLIDILDNWVQGSHTNLKLCVSSREDNIFMNRYREHQRFRLHEMTWYDLRRYTKTHLGHLQHKSMLERLCVQVPNKAQGIFLWCTLVVQALRREIEVDPHNTFAGSPTRESCLMRLLDELPADLEDMFRYILNRLSRQEKMSFYQTLSMVKASAETPANDPVHLWLIAYSFLDEYNTDPGFALNRNSRERSVEKKISREATTTYALRKLQHESGGLLEGVGIDGINMQLSVILELGYKSDDNIRPIVVGYAHRSVPEILERSEFASERKTMLGGFSAADAIVNLSLAHWRFCAGSMQYNRALFTGLARCILTMPFDKTNFEVLDTLDSLSNGSMPGDSSSVPKPFYCYDNGVKSSIGWATPHYDAKRGTNYGKFNSLFLALGLRRYDYVLWKINYRAHAMGLSTKKAELTRSVLNIQAPQRDSGQLQVGLFAMGCFAEPFATGLTRLPYHPKPVHVRNMKSMTIWRDFLAVNWYRWYQAPRMNQRRFGRWLEMFLKCGVLCEFELVITRSTGTEYATLTLGEVEVDILPMYEESLPEYQETVEATWIFKSDIVYTLADWIRVIDLPNLNQILSLLRGSNTTVRHHGQIK